MKRSEWIRQITTVGNRGEELKTEFDQNVEKLEGTYGKEKERWSNELDEAHSEVVDAVAGGSAVALTNATNREEYAQHMLKALDEGRAKKLGELEHGYELDKSANDLELQELYSEKPFVEVAIDNMEVFIESFKLGYQTVSGTELPPVDVGGILGWELIKGQVRNVLDRAEVVVNNIMEKYKGDPLTPREEKLEHWIDEAQSKFDEKYKDAPAKERNSMQEKLDENFDLLRAALERQQERQQQPNIEPDHPER